MSKISEKIKELISRKGNLKIIIVVAIVIITVVAMIFRMDISPVSDSGTGRVDINSEKSVSDETGDKKNGIDITSGKEAEQSDGAGAKQKMKGNKSSQSGDDEKHSSAEAGDTSNTTGAVNRNSESQSIENHSGGSVGRDGQSEAYTNSIQASVTNDTADKSSTIAAEGSYSEEADDEDDSGTQAYSIDCNISIDCSSISGNNSLTDAGRPELEEYASNPDILAPTGMNIVDSNGDGKVGVDEAIKQACDTYGIQYEFKGNSYLRGMNYLYEFDAGPDSGWMYMVNGRKPSVGCNSYYLRGGENVKWFYVTSY